MRTLKTNLQGTGIANYAVLPLASLDSANFFDNLKTPYLFTFLGNPSYAMEKEMTTHPRILAWRTAWTEEPGRLQSMGSQGVGHD